MMDGAVHERLMPVEELLDWHPDSEKWELAGGISVRSVTERALHKRPLRTSSVRFPAECVRCRHTARQVALND